jgi:hypothetical protein
VIDGKRGAAGSPLFAHPAQTRGRDAPRPPAFAPARAARMRPKYTAPSSAAGLFFRSSAHPIVALLIQGPAPREEPVHVSFQVVNTRLGRFLTIEGRGAIMEAVATQPHVTLSGDINGDYVVKDELPGGELTLVPDTSIDAVRQRLGTEPMSAEEFERHFGELPTDDEG